MWLALAQLLASFLKIIADKQLIDAGAAKVVAANANASLAAIAKAIRARDGVRDDPDSVRNDPDNIDRKQ
jgi:hypothetical protein